jgi:DNA-binding response OmpR family regulator
MGRKPAGRTRSCLSLYPARLTESDSTRLKSLFLLSHSGHMSGVKLRVLVVDDEPDITSIIQMGLERMGFSVSIYNSPADALKECMPGAYDIALLDVRMPGMNGFELYQELQKKDAQVKPCFMSAFDISSEELAKFFPSNERPFIRKPFVLPDLVKKLSEVPQTS